MLFLVTHREDVTADWLVLELRRQGRSFVRVNSEDFPEAAAIRWAPDHAELEIADDLVVADQVSSVWWRRSIAPVLSGGDRTAEEAHWAWEESDAAWSGFWHSIDAHWVNHPDAITGADIKPRQLRLARAVGLSLPATMMTNDPTTARAFAERHSVVVCKAIRSGVIGEDPTSHRVLYTQRLDEKVVAQLEKVGPEPYLLQELVPKACDVRVTVVGDQAFGCRIDSQDAPGAEVDWRLGELVDLRHQPIDLPDAIARASVELAHRLSLRFAALDFALTPDGQWVFFEINPNGQWAWIEQLTGQPLAAAIVAELCR